MPMTTKEIKTNELIPILIDKFTEYSNKLRDRIKINGIFSEFDENARANLNKFIKLSQMRYKGVKSGNSLENLLHTQKPKYNKLTNEILGDKFYQTNEIEIENKKLFKKPNKKENNEIYELRNQIKQGARDFSKQELRKREILLRKANKKRELRKKKEEKMKFSRLAFNYHPGYLEKNEQTLRTVEQEEEAEEKALNKENQHIEKIKFCNEIDNLINEDQEKFDKNINEYHEYLKEIIDTHNKGEQIKLNTNPKLQNFNFLTDEIKLLNYKEETNEKVIPKKNEDSKIDIMKLMRYTKRGKSAKWLSPRPFSNSNFDTTHSTFNSGMGKTFSDFRNTIKTVKEEAEKNIRLDENFDCKRETMDNFFKNNELPRLDEYENLLNLKGKGEQWDLDNLKKDKGASKSGYQPRRKNILSAFNRVYQRKRGLWKKEDQEVQNKKQRDLEIKRQINNYLKEIKNTKRKPHLFVDGYSQRDGFTNEQINAFSRTLNGGFFSKKAIEHKVLEFDEKNKLKAQRKKSANQRRIVERNINESTRNKENELENEIMEKIRNNLKDEEESEDIEFNYLVNGQKIEGKNK